MPIVNLQATVTFGQEFDTAALYEVQFNNALSSLGTLVNAGRYDIIIEQGAVNVEHIKWLNEDGDPHDLTDYAAKLQARVLQRDNEVLFDLSTPNQIVLTPSTGDIVITLTESESEELDFDLGVYDLLLYPKPVVPVNSLAQAGTDFTSAAMVADNGSGRGVVTLTGGTFPFSALNGEVVHIYDTENNDTNGGVYIVHSFTSTVLTLTTPMAADNVPDTTVKIQLLDSDNVVRLVEGNVYLHRRVTEA